jgi:hypothetical protein
LEALMTTSTLLVLLLLSQAALAEGGTLLYPKPDGTLRPGAYASLGLGVDNAR